MNRDKKIKFLLFFAILLVIGIVLTVFIGYRTVSNPEEMILKAVRNDAAISVENVTQISTRDGVKEWSLKAASADFMDEEKTAVFKDLAVTFYMRDGRTLHLSADSGRLNTDSRDISLAGNVTADDGMVNIKTDRLNYRHETRLLFTGDPVQITGDAFRLRADEAAYDMNSQTTTFRGNVKGTLFETVKM